MNKEKERRNEDLEDVLNDVVLTAPLGPTANLHLPDPGLRDYYLDEQNRIFRIDSEVGDHTLDLLNLIIKCNKEDAGIPIEQRKPIRVLINTPGGDSGVCLVLMNAIRASTTPVWTINMCRAYSSGGLILLCGHKRFALKGSSVVIHRGSMAMSGEVSIVVSAQKFMRNMDKKIEDLLFELTKIPKNFYEKHASSDIYYDSEGALKYGIVDYIVENFEEVF